MTHSLHLKTIITLCLAWWMTASLTSAEVVSRMSSRFIARGEQAMLEIAIIGNRPKQYPVIPETPGIQIRPADRGPRPPKLLSGRRLEYVFEYIITSYDIGKHTIPPITVTTEGQPQTTQALDFSVFNPDELKWQEATAGELKFRYASSFRALNDNPYEGETIPVEIKIYIPRDLFIADWGIPDFERDGVTAWRFQPSEMTSQVNLLGSPYVSVAYPSTLTPTRSGPISIGPADIRLITTQSVMDGILRRIAVETHLQAPRLNLISQALPDGAPAGYENAVGNFKINVTTAQTNVQEGEPIAIQITVNGSGNLDTLKPPTAAETSGWKLYDPSTEQRGDERREVSGTTIFNQFIRPLEMKGSIPSFRLVFFNPQTHSYETVTSDPIPLQMTPSTIVPTVPTGPPPAANTPIEKMTDILGLIPSPNESKITPPSSNGIWIHLTGGFIALLLIIKILWQKYHHKRPKNTNPSKRLSELKNLELTTQNDLDFLMNAGRFIEHWHGNHPSAELQAILSERDSLCFRPDKDSKTILTPDRRSSILRALRQASMILILLLSLAATSHTHASETQDQAADAYQSGRYADAITTWLNSSPYDTLSADTLYHIGNACYRAGSAGYAALYYRRALARDPSHQESRQNLRFIERTFGSISIKRPDFQYAITRVPLSLWQNITWVGIWITLLSMLVFPATRSGARIRIAAILGLVAAPLLAMIGGIGWLYFPNDAEFSPLSSQAVIIHQSSKLYTDASRTSPEIIEAPVGSLCNVLNQSGEWSYVAFASNTRGWIPSASIELILPNKPPSPPQIQKTKATEKNA